MHVVVYRFSCVGYSWLDWKRTYTFHSSFYFSRRCFDCSRHSVFARMDLDDFPQCPLIARKIFLLEENNRSDIDVFSVLCPFVSNLELVKIFHRVQKSCRTFEICCHVDRRLAGIDVRSISGKAVNGLPIKQWAGVRIRMSFGSADSGVRGLEFKIPSISIVKMFNSSKVNRRFPTTRLK